MFSGLSMFDLQHTYLSDDALITETDTHGIITDASKAFLKRVGYTHNELIGKTHKVINSGYHHPEFFENLWKTIVQGKVWLGTICDQTKNGKEVWFDTLIIPLLDNRNQPIKFVALRSEATR